MSEMKQSNQSKAFLSQRTDWLQQHNSGIPGRGIETFQAESATQEALGGSEALFWVVKAVGV